VAFDGSTGFLKTPQSAVNTTGSYSVSAWVKINSAVNATAVCQGTTQHQAFYLSYDSGKKGWMFQTTTTNDANASWPTAEGGTGTAPVGTWTHLLVTYTAPVVGNSSTGLMSIYQNGSLMGTATNTAPQYDSSLPLTIGGCVNSASATTPYSAFPGSVADVHVYPYAMTAAQAQTGSLIVPNNWTNGMPEDEWKLSADGTDNAALNAFVSTGGVTFTTTDHPTSTSAGSGSVAFDGSTGFLRSSQTAVNTLGNYSISAWVKINTATTGIALCQATTQHQAFELGYDSGDKAWMFQTTTTNDASSSWPTAEGGPNTAPVGTWTHLVATYVASTGVMSLYQNGSLMGNDVNHTPQYDSSLPLTVGGCVQSMTSTTPHYTFPGSVADLHVYPAALSATQVAALS
jgi:hypothetical protein